MNPPARVVIATRKSPLALWQAEHVRELLSNTYSGMQIELLGMTTLGDRILDRPLSQEGGKGLFVKELELALLDGRAHLAVHSLKDVPMHLDAEFALAAVLTREDPRDCMVSNRYAALEDMPAGARIGTSSLRRELMLRARFPQLVIGSIRGNVGTRLAKLDNGEFDALVLAAAGLKRLGFAARIRQIISTEVSLPAPGQGALGIEIKSSDVRNGDAALSVRRCRDACRHLRRARCVSRTRWQLPGAVGRVCGSRRRCIAVARVSGQCQDGQLCRSRSAWTDGGAGSAGVACGRAVDCARCVAAAGCLVRQAASMLVIVTRPASAGQRLFERLLERGHRAWWWPVFDIGAAPDAQRARTTLARLADYDLAIFVSANAVRAAQPLLSGAWPPGTMMGAVGASTRAALEADLKPASELGGVGAR